MASTPNIIAIVATVAADAAKKENAMNEITDTVPEAPRDDATRGNATSLLDVRIALTAAVDALIGQRDVRRIERALGTLSAVLVEETRWRRNLDPSLRRFLALPAGAVPETHQPIFTKLQDDARRVLGEHTAAPAGAPTTAA